MSISAEDIFLDRKSVCVIIIVYVYERESEVELINKQKFLAELSKLLTFMYEEDRQEALAMYSSMFDEAEDEQRLIQLLMSPTRQAVIVARAYDAKDRKLQVTSQSRDGSGLNDGETPDFAVAIEKVRKEAEERDILRAGVSDDQMSFFEEEKPVAAEVVAEPEVPAAEEAKEPGEEISDGFAKKQVLDEDELFEDIMKEEEPLAVEAIPAEERDAAEPEEEAEAAEPEGEPEEKQKEAAEEPQEPEESEEPEVTEEVPEVEETELVEAAEPFDYTKVPDEDGYIEPEKEAMVGWLTLFVIFAIPIGFAACVLMIVLALVFLALAATVVAAGVFAIRSLFSGFAVFADILLVGGAAVAALALGLLFLWTAIWCLFGAIPGIVRGIIELGRSWCYKEVAE